MKLKALALAALVVSGSAWAQGRPDLVEQSLRGGRAQFVPGELLVQFKPGTSAQAQASAIAFLRSSRKETVLSAARRGDGKGDLQLLTLPPGLAITDAFRAMSQLVDVDFAEPNWIYTKQLVPNDTRYSSLWGMKAYPGIRAETAWNKETDCSGIYVGIIDEGYYFSHSDLQANSAVNPYEGASVNRKDDDANGLIDDIRGWDFANNDASVFDGTIDDHGTHVAGTIGAVGNNAGGVAGVCWKVNLLNAKFLGRNGGTTANAVKAVDYFTGLKKKGLNLVATSNSWGGGGYSSALDQAIKAASDADVLFIAAAGNSALDCDISDCYPAKYSQPNVIAVASIDNTGSLSSFSNYGKATVHIAAPGGGILSTVPQSSKGGVISGYASYSGTSMATPHVSGAAALYKAINPAATAVDIKNALIGLAFTDGALKVIGGKRLDVGGF